MNFDDAESWINLARNMGEEVKDGCKPLFYMRPIQDKAASDAEGRAIYKEVPYVQILIPGQKLSKVDEKVNDDHKKRWPLHWAQFQQNKQAVEVGTRLELWPYLNQSQVAELKSMQIYTVEQLDALKNNDAAIARLGMGGRDLVKRAGEFLKPADEQMVGTRKELKAATNEIARLTQENEQLKREIDRLNKLVPAAA